MKAILPVLAIAIMMSSHMVSASVQGLSDQATRDLTTDTTGEIAAHVTPDRTMPGPDVRELPNSDDISGLADGVRASLVLLSSAALERSFQELNALNNPLPATPAPDLSR